jgi:microcystin-dependent protein
MTSVLRRKNRTINRIVYQENHLTKFLDPPMNYGNLIVKNHEKIGGDLDISGNLAIDGNISATNYYASGNYYLNNYVLIPAGTIIQSAAVNEPTGWFNCDGRLLLRTQYGALFAAILYTYSATFSGTDLSFNIPDLRGRTSVGSGNGSGLTNRSLGQTGGAETHTLTTNEMPSHSHTSNADGENIGLIVADTFNTLTESDTSPNESNLVRRDALVINNTGGGQAHNNMQPFIVLRYLIKY